MVAVQNVPAASQPLTRHMNREVILVRKKGAKEGKALKMIPVGMANKNMPPLRMIPFCQFLSQFPDARTAVQNKQLLCVGKCDLHAGSIPSKGHMGWIWTRH